MRHHVLGMLGFAVAGALAAWPAPSPASAQPGTTVFEGARLITDGDRPPIEDSVLVAQGATIVGVGRRRDVRVPEGAVRIDLTGKTVMPAIINLHGHLGYLKGDTFLAANYTRENILDQLSQYAYYGVAAVVTTGTDAGDLTFQLRREPHPGALLRTAGRGFAAPNAGPGFPAMRDAPYGVTTEAEARRYVRELAEKKPDFLKIWVDDRNGTVQKLGPTLYRAIIDEAHKHRLKVMAHVYYLSDARDLVEAGVDGFLHLVRDAEMDETLARRMKERRVLVTPNLGVSGRNASGGPPWFDDLLLAETVPSGLLRRIREAAATRSPAAGAAAAASYARQLRSLATLNRAGVTIALGDDTGIPEMFPGYSEIQELGRMVEGGMTPAQVIVAATRTPAELLGLPLGAIARGKSADFIVLDANPLDDIANARRISRVFLRGQEVDRASLRARWTGSANR
jgi:imidazolonepropionase-like amidohydrolase